MAPSSAAVASLETDRDPPYPRAGAVPEGAGRGGSGAAYAIISGQTHSAGTTAALSQTTG
jgi:hypothetical protein